MDDLAVVAAQLGRMPRAFRRVAARCPFGCPAVTEQHPYGPDGEPFPTMYYLTCRHLVAAVSRLEAGGGVERWSDAVAHDASLRAEVERATVEQARLRLAAAGDAVGRDDGASLASGIGGSQNPMQLKCLHAHVAYALAQPGYALGECVLEEVPERWPAQCCGGCGEPPAVESESQPAPAEPSEPLI